MIGNIGKATAVPAHIQVRDFLLKQIKTGSLKPADKIPSERELSRLCNVSRVTIRKSIGSLVNEGLLVSVPSKGTFVNEVMQREDLEYVESFFSQGEKRGFVGRIRLLEEELVIADVEMAERLKVDEGEKLFRINRLKLANGMPLCSELRYIPYKFIPEMIGRKLAERSLTEYLKKRSDLKVAHRELQILPILIDDKTATLLRTYAGAPVLLVTEILSLEDGSVLKWEQQIHKTGLLFNTRTTIKQGSVGNEAI